MGLHGAASFDRGVVDSGCSAPTTENVSWGFGKDAGVYVDLQSG